MKLCSQLTNKACSQDKRVKKWVENTGKNGEECDKKADDERDR